MEQTGEIENCTVSMEPGSSMGSMTTTGRSIELDFQGTDYDVLRDEVDRLAAELRKRDDVMQVHSSVENAAADPSGRGGSGEGPG